MGSRLVLQQRSLLAANLEGPATDGLQSEPTQQRRHPREHDEAAKLGAVREFQRALRHGRVDQHLPHRAAQDAAEASPRSQNAHDHRDLGVGGFVPDFRGAAGPGGRVPPGEYPVCNREHVQDRFDNGEPPQQENRQGRADGRNEQHRRHVQPVAQKAHENHAHGRSRVQQRNARGGGQRREADRCGIVWNPVSSARPRFRGSKAHLT